jgi:hypothetical protein
MKSLSQILNEGLHDPETPDETLERKTLHYDLIDHYNFSNKKDLHNIKNYTAGDTQSNYLWNKHAGTDKRHAGTDKQVNSLNNTLKIHKTPHDMTVYSNSKMDPREKKNAEGVVHHPAFMSTTIEKGFAKDWENTTRRERQPNGVIPRDKHVLAIHVPKGSHGAYVDHLSELPGQSEFILPKAANLKYHSTESHVNPEHKELWNGDKIENHTHYHHMTLLGHNE